jgi:hypothetical protein
MRGARRALLVVVALLAKDTVRADGPSNEKPYGDWDRSDVRRILFDSPWVRHFTLRQVPPNAAETSPPKVLDEFEVAIAGPDMSGFDGVREPTLRSKCYLWVSSRRKIAPWRVEFARSGNGKMRGVLFRFPRKTADGEPLISSHDTRVWFIEYGGGVEIRVAFSLRAMVDSNGLDL